MKLENESLSVEIAELGAEVIRIFDKQKSTEVLWEGDPVYWKRHAPVLFPNVGKTWQNRVLVQGIQYPTTQHGFARDSVFSCTHASAESAAFMLRATEESREVYPYDFELDITYRLSEKELEVEWKVKNCGEEIMYFTIGGHPAFRFAGKEEKKEDYVLKFPGKKELRFILIDPVTGTGRPDTEYLMRLEEDGTCSMSEEMFAKDAMIFDNGQIEEVWLCHKDKTPYVGIRCEGFPNFGIWSVKNAPFVCLEPWVGRCDNYGFIEDVAQKPGILMLRSDETYVKTYQILIA